MSVSEHKQERINIRLQLNAKQALERAASLEGKSVSNFILSSALAQAERTIQEHEMLALNKLESEAFLEALDRPVCFNETLLAAIEQYSTRVISQ